MDFGDDRRHDRLMDDGHGFDSHEEIITREDGTRLVCTSAGQGPTIVLAHGYLDDQFGYDEVVPRLLAAGRRVVRFDQRGHGRSNVGTDGLSPRAMAGDYRAVIEHFNVKDGVLVGHSMGAFLSVVFAILHADVARSRLRRLVLVGGHAGDVAKGSVQNRIQVPLIKYGMMRLVLGTRTTARWMARSLFGDVAEPRFVAKAIEIFRRAGGTRTLPILRAQVSESYYDRLGEVPVPAIVICGERDRTCPRFHSERLGAEIHGSRNVWLPRVGHMVTYEAPQTIVDAVMVHEENGVR
jgi:non-heme chloroperoxidase